MEAGSKTVELDQDPTLFALIVQHMSGYRIIPISPNYLPPGMTQEVAMENLVHDAKFFGLEGLYKLLTLPALPPHIQRWDVCGINGPVVDFEDVIYGRLPPGTLYTRDGLCSQVDGITRPVLVYGKNMPLDIHWKLDPTMMLDEPDRFIYNFNLQLLPSQAQNLGQQHPAWSKRLTSEYHIGRLKAEPAYRQDTSIHIDGRKALMSNLSLWIEHAHIPPEERIQQPRYDDFRVFDEAFPGIIVSFEDGEPTGRELQLWGDGFFFVIHFHTRQRDSREGPIYLQLMDIKAKTPGTIMDAAFPPL